MGIPNLTSVASKIFGPSTSDREILMSVAEETGYNIETLWKIYGYESSFGTDPNMNVDNKGLPKKHQGPFQFSKSLADSLGIDRHDLYQSSKAYVQELDTRRRSMEQNIQNTSGDFSLIDSLDPALLDYLLHQQGGLGVARMALAHYSGESYTGHEEGSQGYMNDIEPTLLGNLSKDQQKKFKLKRNPREKIEYFIEQTKIELGER